MPPCWPNCGVGDRSKRLFINACKGVPTVVVSKFSLCLLILAVFVILAGNLGCKFAGKRAVDVVEVGLESREDECESLEKDSEVLWDRTPYIEGDQLLLSGQVKGNAIIHDSRIVAEVDGVPGQTMATFVLLGLDVADNPVAVGRIWHPDLTGYVGPHAAANLYPLPEDYRVDGGDFSVKVQLPDSISSREVLYIMIVEQMDMSDDRVVWTKDLNSIGFTCVARSS